jgi:hypothetical protein
MAETEKKKAKKMKDYRQAQIVRLDIISELYKRGYSYREIRDEVMARLDLSSYSLRTVSKDVNRLLQEWRETRIENTDLALQLELERLDAIVKEAWAAWEKSKEDYTTRNSKQKGVPSDLVKKSDDEGSDTKSEEIITVQMEQSSKEVVCTGDPRYLDIIHKALIERRKLLGLYAPEKKDISGGMSFEALLMETGIVDNEEK